jgi:hypothetical protein
MKENKSTDILKIARSGGCGVLAAIAFVTFSVNPPPPKR